MAEMAFVTAVNGCRSIKDPRGWELKAAWER